MALEGKLALKGRPLEVVGRPGGLEILSSSVGSGEHALLVFVTNRSVLTKHLGRIVRSASADRVTWVAYPKGGQLSTDLNRDSLAATLLSEGVRPVTQVSIDSTWSALRFRPAG